MGHGNINTSDDHGAPRRSNPYKNKEDGYESIPRYSNEEEKK